MLLRPAETGKSRMARRAVGRKQVGGAHRHCLDASLDVVRCGCATHGTLRVAGRGAFGISLLSCKGLVAFRDMYLTNTDISRLRVGFLTTEQPPLHYLSPPTSEPQRMFLSGPTQAWLKFKFGVLSLPCCEHRMTPTEAWATLSRVNGSRNNPTSS